MIMSRCVLAFYPLATRHPKQKSTLKL